MVASVRRYLLKLSEPIQRLLQLIGKPGSLVPDSFYPEVMLEIKDGDVLLSHETWHLTNLFIPGYYKHAAVYFEGYVIEAVGVGVRRVHLAKWLYDKDSVCVVRANVVGKRVGRFALSQVGKPYDYQFEKSVESFYCSELVWMSLNAGSRREIISKRRTMGVETVLAQDFRDAVSTGSFELIKEFKHDHESLLDIRPRRRR